MIGMLVTGRADTYESGHSIFLPAAGISFFGQGSVDYKGTRGYYWSTGNERLLRIADGDCDMDDASNPLDGLTVRPVLAE